MCEISSKQRTFASDLQSTASCFRLESCVLICVHLDAASPVYVPEALLRSARVGGASRGSISLAVSDTATMKSSRNNVIRSSAATRANAPQSPTGSTKPTCQTDWPLRMFASLQEGAVCAPVHSSRMASIRYHKLHLLLLVRRTLGRPSIDRTNIRGGSMLCSAYC